MKEMKAIFSTLQNKQKYQLSNILNIHALSVMSLWLLIVLPIGLKADWTTTDYNIFEQKVLEDGIDLKTVQVKYMLNQVSEAIIRKNIQNYKNQLFYDAENMMVVNVFDFNLPLSGLNKFQRPNNEQLDMYIKGGGYLFKYSCKYKTVLAKQGIKWFQKAAEQGHEDAIEQLRKMGMQY